MIIYVADFQLYRGYNLKSDVFPRKGYLYFNVFWFLGRKGSSLELAMPSNWTDSGILAEYYSVLLSCEKSFVKRFSRPCHLSVQTHFTTRYFWLDFLWCFKSVLNTYASLAFLASLASLAHTSIGWLVGHCHFQISKMIFHVVFFIKTARWADWL